MPTATEEEAKLRPLEPSRQSQEQHQHQPCAHLMLPCNNKPATEQKQKYVGPSDYIKAIPTPIYDPYLRDRINQQLDQAISILFSPSPSQINQNKESEREHQHDSGSVSNEYFGDSEEITLKLPANSNVAAKRKQKPETKQQMGDAANVFTKRYKNNEP